MKNKHFSTGHYPFHARKNLLNFYFTRLCYNRTEAAKISYDRNFATGGRGGGGRGGPVAGGVSACVCAAAENRTPPPSSNLKRFCCNFGQFLPSLDIFCKVLVEPLSEGI